VPFDFFSVLRDYPAVTVLGGTNHYLREDSKVMRNAKTLAIVVALGLGLIFSSPFVAQAKKGGGAPKESQAGGLPALEDRVEFDEGLIAALTVRVTALETAVAEIETDLTELTNLLKTSLHRLSAEFQNTTTGVNEESTSLAPTAGGTGGLSVYSKTLAIPFDVVYVTFSAQGDTHGGATLAMSANVTDAAAVTTVCEPMAGQSGGGGGGTAGPSGWMALQKTPTDGTVETAANNCNDGGGGVADCHDNAIMFSCCLRITPDTGVTKHTVEIRLGSEPNPQTPLVATNVFYERSTIYIDASTDPAGTLCSGVGTANHL
jgi:hypothetical protein